MNVKEYLNQVKSVDGMIQRKQEQIDALRSLASSTALHTDSERVQSSGSKDKIGDCVAKIVDLCAEINADIDAFVDMKADIMRKIDTISLDERYILYCRYFQYMEFFKIAHEMHVSESTVYRLHKSGIKQISEMIESESS